MFGWGSVDERYMKLAGKAAEGVILVMHRFLVAKQLPDDDPVKAVILKYQKEHKERFGAGFTSKYNVSKLVYFEETGDVHAALSREKEIKKWRRAKKNALVVTMNPQWRDLSAEF